MTDIFNNEIIAPTAHSRKDHAFGSFEEIRDTCWYSGTRATIEYVQVAIAKPVDRWTWGIEKFINEKTECRTIKPK